MSKRYRVLVRATALGSIDVEASGTRSAVRKVRAMLTMSPNPVSHLDLLQPVVIETPSRAEEIPDDNETTPDSGQADSEGGEG